MLWSRRRFLVAAATFAGACTTAPSRPGDALVQLSADPTQDRWPSELAELSQETQAMYRYAAANRATLQYIPCFCGCVGAGHESNFDCYVQEVLPDGRIRLDTMSFG